MIDELHVYTYGGLDIYRVSEHYIKEIVCEYDERVGHFYNIEYSDGRSETLLGFQYKEIHYKKESVND